MEEFLSSFESRSTGQKILIIVGGAAILLVFISLSAIITSPSSKKSANSSSPPVVNPAPTLSAIPKFPSSITDPLFKNWQTYSGQNFTVKYPQNWKAETRNEDQIERIMIIPQGVQSAVPTALYIEVYLSSKVSLVDREAPLIDSNYKKSEGIIVDGSKTDILKGFITAKNSDSVNIKIQETYRYIDLGSRQYSIKSFYSGEVNSVLEDYFDKMVKTFKII